MTGTFSHETLIRVFSADDFRLELYDLNHYSRGRRRLSYRLYDGGKLIFEGHDFGPSPLHADDSDQCVAELLHFLSLEEGDTDSEYFDDYTPEQIEWRDIRASDLQLVAYDLEESREDGPELPDNPADDQPSEDDYTSSDGRRWYQYGKLAVVGDVKAVRDHMERNQFFPSVFMVSDHGNVTPVEI